MTGQKWKEQTFLLNLISVNLISVNLDSEKSGFSEDDGFNDSVKRSNTMKPVCAILA